MFLSLVINEKSKKWRTSAFETIRKKHGDIILSHKKGEREKGLIAVPCFKGLFCIKRNGRTF